MSDHRRTVRSFVRRAGRITPSQQRALDELWPRYGIDFTPERLDLDALFGRTAPKVLEIGFGDGETLVEQAAAARDRDFIGIEVHRPGIGHCLLKAEAEGLANLRIIAHDAVEVLEHLAGAGQLDRINLYFPDPWPKKRHHKRRIVKPGFLALVAGCLKPGGSLHIATDWGPYAEHIDETLALTGLFHIGDRREHAGNDPLDRPTTKFERRGLKKGHKIVDWRLVRI